MPLYVADYLSATEHLDAAHSGAYLHLIMHYWQKGCLPTNDIFLARVARMTPRQWSVARETLAAFFGQDWTHDRIDSELAKCRQKAQARADSGSRGGYAKSLKGKSLGLANATDLPEQTASKTHSKPLPSSSGLDIELTSVSSKKSTAIPDALNCLSPETARAVIEHRKAKKAPLTLRAAELLASSFVASGDPEGAAAMMIARGWQGFEVSWFEKEKRDDERNGKRSVQAISQSNIKNGISIGPIPPPYVPGRNGGEASSLVAGLLPQGGGGRPGDLRGGDYGDADRVSGSRGDEGDRPAFGNT